jgi:hypothetical protein
LSTEHSATTPALVLRNAAGQVYVLPEPVLHACQASPAQQQALERLIGDDVVGYADPGGGLVVIGAITVAPQINTNVGFNIAAATFAPVTQVLGQTGLNAFTGSTALRG